jgi:hypothetical protein
VKAVLAVLACCLAGAAARGNVLGIHTMIQDNAETSQQLDLAAELCGPGGWVKQLFYVQDGTEWSFDSKWLDFVAGARARRLNVVARLHYIPPSYRADPANFAGKPAPGPSGDYARYFTLIRDFVSRFGGALHYVEIWNEPNLSYEWDNQPDPDEFVRALMAGYDGVKAADPSCQVLFPGLAPTDGTPDGRNINNLTFLTKCYQSAAVCPRDGRSFRQHFDVLGSHPYAFNHPPSYRQDRYSIVGYQHELAVCNSFGDAGRKVLLTECGYALGSHEDARYPAVTEELRAQYMTTAFRDVWALDNRVLGAMPYHLHAAERPYDQPFFWVRDDGSRTPQFDAVKALRPNLEDIPGNIINIYGNWPRNQGYVDSVNILDVQRILGVAAGRVPAPGPLVPAYLLTAGDAAEPADGVLTLPDAVAALRRAGGLN